MNDSRISMLIPPEGLNIGDYTIIKELARGGFGITYLAIDSQQDTYIIKEFYPLDFGSSMTRNKSQLLELNDPYEKDSFLSLMNSIVESELNISKKAYHENNDKSMESKSSNSPYVYPTTKIQINNTDTSYLKISTSSGQTFKEFLYENELSLPEKIRQILNIYSSVQYLHKSTGIIHADLKPSNIYISGNTYKLIDFGSSFIKNSFNINDIKTFTFSFTESYCSDRIKKISETLIKADYEYSIGIINESYYINIMQNCINDANHLSEYDDLYSIFCILFYTLFGRCPFTDDLILHDDIYDFISKQKINIFSKRLLWAMSLHFLNNNVNYVQNSFKEWLTLLLSSEEKNGELHEIYKDYCKKTDSVKNIKVYEYLYSFYEIYSDKNCKKIGYYNIFNEILKSNTSYIIFGSLDSGKTLMLKKLFSEDIHLILRQGYIPVYYSDESFLSEKSLFEDLTIENWFKPIIFIDGLNKDYINSNNKEFNDKYGNLISKKTKLIFTINYDKNYDSYYDDFERIEAIKKDFQVFLQSDTWNPKIIRCNTNQESISESCIPFNLKQKDTLKKDLRYNKSSILASIINTYEEERIININIFFHTQKMILIRLGINKDPVKAELSYEKICNYAMKLLNGQNIYENKVCIADYFSNENIAIMSKSQCKDALYLLSFNEFEYYFSSLILFDIDEKKRVEYLNKKILNESYITMLSACLEYNYKQTAVKILNFWIQDGNSFTANSTYYINIIRLYFSLINEYRETLEITNADFRKEPYLKYYLQKLYDNASNQNISFSNCIFSYECFSDYNYPVVLNKEETIKVPLDKTYLIVNQEIVDDDIYYHKKSANAGKEICLIEKNSVDIIYLATQYRVIAYEKKITYKNVYGKKIITTENDLTKPIIKPYLKRIGYKNIIDSLIIDFHSDSNTACFLLKDKDEFHLRFINETKKLDYNINKLCTQSKYPVYVDILDIYTLIGFCSIEQYEFCINDIEVGTANHFIRLDNLTIGQFNENSIQFNVIPIREKIKAAKIITNQENYYLVIIYTNEIYIKGLSISYENFINGYGLYNYENFFISDNGTIFFLKALNSSFKYIELSDILNDESKNRPPIHFKDIKMIYDINHIIDIKNEKNAFVFQTILNDEYDSVLIKLNEPKTEYMLKPTNSKFCWSNFNYEKCAFYKNRFINVQENLFSLYQIKELLLQNTHISPYNERILYLMRNVVNINELEFDNTGIFVFFSFISLIYGDYTFKKQQILKYSNLFKSDPIMFKYANNSNEQKENTIILEYIIKAFPIEKLSKKEFLVWFDQISNMLFINKPTDIAELLYLLSKHIYNEINTKLSLKQNAYIHTNTYFFQRAEYLCRIAANQGSKNAKRTISEYDLWGKGKTHTLIYYNSYELQIKK